MNFQSKVAHIFQFSLLLLLLVPITNAQQSRAIPPPSPYKTAPADLPQFDVILNEPERLGEGYLFVGYFNYADFRQSTTYMLILDNDGEPVFYRPLEPLGAIIDFKRQKLHSDRITWFNPAPTEQRFAVLDEAYRTIGYYAAGNGFATDLHDLQMLKNGHALLMIYERRVVDMSQLVAGGHPEAVVTGCVLQEIDANNNVVFEWQSWDHISILDTVLDVTAAAIDYMHCNSIEEDWDGNWLISSRHTSEVTKINRQTGEVIWRLGGKSNQFTFVNDDGFSFQHDARRLPNGNLTLYDNGVLRGGETRYSRAVEYELDTVAMTATQVWSYRNIPDAYGFIMGSVQRLTNGNTLIGWGGSSVPMVTEVAADGTKLLEMSSLLDNGSYRVVRYPWVGRPTWPPALVVVSGKMDAHLYFSWNGATEVVAYQVFAGRSPDSLTAVATVSRNGFETEFVWMPSESGSYYFQVLPVMKDGSVALKTETVLGIVGGWTNYLPLARRSESR